MPFAEIINHGPEGCETLDLETSFRHAYNSVEYVRIGVLPEDAIGEQGTISFQLVHFSVDWKCTSLQANLLDSEIDMVIESLQKAKTRMKEIQCPSL